MARESYNHLKSDLEAYKIPFSGYGGGQKAPTIPSVQNRATHAARLSSDLDRIVASKVDLRDPAVPEEDAGYHVTASARTNLGVMASGALAEVLSVKGDGRRQRVNMFIRASLIEAAKIRLAKYADFETGKKPWSFTLFETASGFHGSTLDDLWTDPIEPVPGAQSGAAEWEVWIRAGTSERMRSFAGRYGVRFEPGQADFPSVSVLRARAAPSALTALVDATSAVLELRACSSLTLQMLDTPVSAQRALASGLASRIIAPPVDAPVVCILDSGVFAQHPLLEKALDPDDCRTLNDAWDRFGWNEHGTRVAGIALYPDLRDLISRPRSHRLTTRLESVVVLRPLGATRSQQESIGEIVAAVAAVEADATRRRVFCMAAVDLRGMNDGSPTKLSGTVDQLAWGHNGMPRLFCVAAGNILDDPLAVAGYAARNEAEGIGSPGQAFNAVTVGGCTFLDEHPHGGNLLCGKGDLSASSRTSRPWLVRRAIKPDLVYEAGNRGVPDDPNELASEPLSELDVLTTNGPGRQLLATLGETSAATAAVAGMAGRLWALYPDYRPETIRALLVHSASWTDAMRARANGLDKAEASEAILSMFGWGVPDEESASRSAADRLTLVIEDSLVPFKLKGSKVALNECAYHALPWPIDALETLGSTKVELRVTLSYFIQPDMRAPSARNHAGYPSHRFAFDLKGPDDDEIDVIRRGNAAMKGLRSSKPPPRAESRWQIGSSLRERGTIHHDVWIGPADELARQDAIRITPKGGWWSTGGDTSYAGTEARYSLVASIRTPTGGQDIYNAAEARVASLRGARIATLQRLRASRVGVIV